MLNSWALIIAMELMNNTKLSSKKGLIFTLTLFLFFKNILTSYRCSLILDKALRIHLYIVGYIS
jgi:hypothetical protein